MPDSGHPPDPAARVAIITGGAGALGSAVTARLLGDGVTVCVPVEAAGDGDRLRAGVPAAVAERLMTRTVDVRDLDAMTAFVDAVAERHRRIDILVTLVGGFAGGALLETDRATWERMLAMNLTSTFVATRAVAPHLVKAGRGRIVTIASRAVLPPTGGFIAYTTAKAGVIAFTEALAHEMRGHGVTVNTVLPSTMDTQANRAAMPDSDRKGWVPVESVADVIAFLVGNEAADVTGALLTV
jgi:NAD(P)-dependent dehydrogenase (short-subunit alcohol dehydrogenase family)